MVNSIPERLLVRVPAGDDGRRGVDQLGGGASTGIYLREDRRRPSKAWSPAMTAGEMARYCILGKQRACLQPTPR